MQVPASTAAMVLLAACVSPQKPVANPAAAASPTPSHAVATPEIGNELFTCQRERDATVAILADSSARLRECQLAVTSLRAENDKSKQHAQLMADEQAAHQGGWWCLESLATESGSGCARTLVECQSLAAEIRTTTLMVPGRCQWQARAACFVLHAKLPDQTSEICSSLLSRCDEYRQTARKQSRDYQVRSVCRGLE